MIAMRPSPIRGALLLGVLVLAALTGCGSGSVGPDPTAPSTPVPGASAGSASPAVPTSLPPLPGQVPAPARARSEAGAAAFVTHYFLVLNTAWMTPKAGLLPPLADPGCTACSVFEQTALMLTADGQRYTSVPNTVQSVAPAGGAEPSADSYPVVATVSQNGASIVDGQGEVAGTDPRTTVKFRFTLHHDGARWQVREIDLTS